MADFVQDQIMENIDGGCKFGFHTAGSPGGAFPAWLINWGAKFTLPGFFENMMKANQNYPEWKEERDLLAIIDD